MLRSGLSRCAVPAPARHRLASRLQLMMALMISFAGSQAMGQIVPQAHRPLPNIPPSLPSEPVLTPFPDALRISQADEEDLELAGKHSPNIERLMEANYKLELEHRHSKLIRTNRRVRRFAVTDPSVVDLVEYSPDEMSIVGIGLGKTDVTFWFEDDDEPAIYEVTVIRDRSLEEQLRIDFGKLERKLALLFPDSSVYLIPLNNQVIVRGIVHDSKDAAQILQIVRGEVDRTGLRRGGAGQNGALTGAGYGLDDGLNNVNGRGLGFDNGIVNQLRVAGESQVMLRVRIAELNRTQARRMGINWNTIFNDGRHVLTSTLGGTPAILQGVFENAEINIAINALASNGTINLLAEPVITTLSGHSASFLSGAEFAVPTIIGLGGGQNTTFRGVGTSLIVTPTIRDRDLVRLQIVPEFSQTTTDNTVNGIPGTNVRRVQTVVELREGQTIVLGGLISRQTTAGVDHVPLLGNIPVIGPIVFKAKSATEGESELLILVTPEIVRPMDADEVPPVPGYYVTNPNNHDLYRYGRTEGNPDQQVYQLPPFGTGQGHGHSVGYSLFNHPPVSPQLAPHATGTFYGNGGYYPQSVMPAQPTPGTNGIPAAPNGPWSGHSEPGIPSPVPMSPSTSPPPIPKPDPGRAAATGTLPGFNTRRASFQSRLPRFKVRMPFVRRPDPVTTINFSQTGH